MPRCDVTRVSPHKRPRNRSGNGSRLDRVEAVAPGATLGCGALQSTKGVTVKGAAVTAGTETGGTETVVVVVATVVVETVVVVDGALACADCPPQPATTNAITTAARTRPTAEA